jgi:hypothetical protein
MHLLDSIDAYLTRRTDGSGYAVLEPVSGTVLAQGSTPDAAHAGALELASRLGRRRLQAGIDGGNLVAADERLQYAPARSATADDAGSESYKQHDESPSPPADTAESSSSGFSPWKLMGIGDADASQNDSLNFGRLWHNYPSSRPYVDPSTGEPPRGFENQCAIKVGVAPISSGANLNGYKGPSVQVNGVRTPTSANQLAAWLTKTPPSGVGKLQDITGPDWQKKIAGKTGIVYFRHYWANPGDAPNNPTGDHIDLWGGSHLTLSWGEAGGANFLRWLGVNEAHVPGRPNLGFSDVRKSKQIVFWPVN